MNNTFKTIILLTLLTFLLIFCGRLLGGTKGMYFAFCFACVMNFSAYWFSDKIVLAAYRATEISEDSIPEVYEIVKDLSLKAKLPMPKIYLIPSASPNAFATGRNPENAALAVSKGLIELLNYEELMGVMGHELSHVYYRDTLTSSIAATLAGAIGMLASIVRWGAIFGGSRVRGTRNNPVALLVMAFVMPAAATLIQLAVSRSREYAADKLGAQLCENPMYLASALRKIDQSSKRIPLQSVSPTSAHLFIVNPLMGSWKGLFSTHPPIEERIARLEKMERSY